MTKETLEKFKKIYEDQKNERQLKKVLKALKKYETAAPVEEVKPEITKSKRGA